MNTEQLKDVEAPIGDFILNQADVNPMRTAQGNYYHYKDVCTLLNSYKAQFKAEQKQLSDADIEKLAEKKYPAKHHKDYDQYRKQEGFIKGFKSALQTNVGVGEWIDVNDRLPTNEDAYDENYDEVLTIQVGRNRPTMMKYWEIKHCPFTKYWMPIKPPINNKNNKNK